MSTPLPQSSRPQGSRRLRKPVAILAAVAVVGAAAFTWWFLSDDAPDAVSIDSAASQVTTTTIPADGAGSDDDSSTDSSPAEGIDGTWTVDTTIGEFSYGDSTGTFVGFRVQEELARVGSATAVGRTPTISGTLTASGTTITEVTIEADMTDLTTNESMRDNKVRQALATSTHPTATFVLSEPIDLPQSALAGDPVTVDAVGDLTVAGVTRSVTISLQAQLTGDTIVVVGSVEVVFADYGVEVPSAPMVLSADDHGIIELQLFFTR